MPQPKQLKSLKDLCIQNVIHNMESLWCRDYLENWMARGQMCRYIIGPFEDLPCPLIEQITVELERANRLKKHHLHLLIAYHLDSLSISRETSDFNSILSLIGIRCKKLRHLRLRRLLKLPRRNLNDVLTFLPQLVTIDFSYSNVCDQTLSVIAAYCRHLRELNVQGCNVSDVGMSSLCYNTSDSCLTPSERPVAATSLVKLNVRGTDVTHHGVMCALEHLKNLQILKDSSLFHAIVKLYNMRQMMEESSTSSGAEVPSYDTLNLRNLYRDSFTCHVVEAQNFTTVLQMCPQLHIIYLTDVVNVKKDSFLPFLSLNTLTELTLTLMASEEHSFDYLILPILLKLGNTLTVLELEGFVDLNIPVIAALCPGLKSINVSEKNSFSSVPPGQVVPRLANVAPMFEHLEILGTGTMGPFCCDSLSPHIWRNFDGDEGITSADMSLLLRSPCLKEATICNINSLTDDILIDVINTTGFPKLQKFLIFHSMGISSRSIWFLLKLNNPLSVLHLQCDDITRKDYDKMVSYVAKSKLDITLEWE